MKLIATVSFILATFLSWEANAWEYVTTKVVEISSWHDGRARLVTQETLLCGSNYMYVDFIAPEDMPADPTETLVKLLMQQHSAFMLTQAGNLARITDTEVTIAYWVDSGNNCRYHEITNR